MTDEHLRELERRFRATGSVEDEAAWLHAQVQSGALEQKRLELAAHSAHEGAARAGGVSVSRCSDLHRNVEIKDWSRRLVELGDREAAVRALLGVCWRLHSEITEADLHPNAAELVGHALTSLQAIESWLLDHNARTRKQAARLGSTYLDSSAWVSQSRADQLARVFYSVASRTSRVLSTGNHDEIWQNLGDGIGSGLRSEEHLGLAPGTTWAHVQSALVPFALGYSDPVRERVEARQREATGE